MQDVMFLSQVPLRLVLINTTCALGKTCNTSNCTLHFSGFCLEIFKCVTNFPLIKFPDLSGDQVFCCFTDRGN